MHFNTCYKSNQRMSAGTVFPCLTYYNIQWCVPFTPSRLNVLSKCGLRLTALFVACFNVISMSYNSIIYESPKLDYIRIYVTNNVRHFKIVSSKESSFTIETQAYSKSTSSSIQYYAKRVSEGD